MTQEKDHWSVDKRIPLALILTLIAQSAGAIWWAAGINQRVVSLEKTEAKAEIVVKANVAAIHSLEIQMGRQGARIEEILRIVQGIDRRLNAPIRGAGQ